ncbi:7-deoxyloganetin glucosyltransferase-like [Ziziphus jujuba]|uniref:Glycosyltransferase n=1 Tax=Ziziphus jujuba TaxID=326968 RepID=A0ABM4A9T3_ZIZJJ|nr:7-deoxyloganetin glucosyltransferase-like [Ziziphus jujuba]
MGSVVEASEEMKPHAVCIPFPAQGHINPMLKLAKLLHQKGFHITFVNTEFNHRRLLRSRGSDSLNGLPTFRFETIPDGLPPSDADATQDVPSLSVATTNYCLAPFRELLHKLNDAASSGGVPPVTCIVSDSIMSFTLDASKELGIPNVLFWTSSPCSFVGFIYYRYLMEKDIIPLKDESYLTNGYLDMVLDWIPGLEGIRLKNMPSFLQTTNPDDIMFNFALREVDRARGGSAVILNTFDDLEKEIIKSLSTHLPPIYTLGPLHLLLKNQIQNKALNGIASNLWKEETECIDWLSSKQPCSVVYVNFGSVTVMTAEQLNEFAWGLANSEQSFLWIVRPDLVMGNSVMLPEEFLIETKNRGLLAKWCAQEQVLSHPSIGGFLTHSGWNSTIESISYGVPMLTWPFFADQTTTSWFCSTKLNVGMEVDGNAKRDEIERTVRELMLGEKGKEMRKKATELKKMAEEATGSPTGSSRLNFEKVINQVLLSQNIN